MVKLLASLAVITFGLTVFNSVFEWRIANEKVASQQRQVYIAQGANVVKINSELINALAAKAAQMNDAQITSLLADEGVTFTVNPRVAANKVGGQ
jgi:hypothetical protein